ncbi:hypothetical protein [Sediminicurvatus halobius]|uniref:Cation/multidrug efflux pump n=1 Tax=Sediminicurvatus halobius TaxID=2182432 RepID=A0A2U2MZB6_9GAMM|nr:hypothetical protein [Spiribacter halobius]PWG62158.1 hypothetical protein DEM34_13580 [Spiribacter halobius]UEX77155.1 hypothetical protein LMH63_14540 [Spiribacter halobius]
MALLSVLAAVLAVAGLLLLLRGLARLRRLRLVSGCACGAGGCALVALGLALAAAGLNLATYQRLTAETPAATLEVTRSGPERYHVLLERPGGAIARQYPLTGDEWQLDARILRWRGPAALLGLDTRFRLERLSGRYQDADTASRQPPSVHDLAGERGLDVWRAATGLSRWLPLVDARYGSAAYLPLADGASYTITVGRDGLIARPANEAAERAIEAW